MPEPAQRVERRRHGRARRERRGQSRRAADGRDRTAVLERAVGAHVGTVDLVDAHEREDAIALAPHEPVGFEPGQVEVRDCRRVDELTEREQRDQARARVLAEREPLHDRARRGIAQRVAGRRRREGRPLAVARVAERRP